MEFRKVLALRGPNMWANFPVLEAWLDLGALKDSPSDSIAGFNDRLMAWLPTMVEHRCSEGVRGGFFQRLREGTWPGHVLEHVALELQELVGMPVKYGRTREVGEDTGVYKVVVQYREEEVGRAAPGGRAAARPGGGPRPALRRGGRGRGDPGPGAPRPVRPEHRVDRQCGPGAGHPAPPPQRGQPGPARPRGPAEAHPHRRDRPHRRHRRVDRAGQGSDPHPAAGRRRAGPRGAARRRRRRRLGGGPRDRRRGGGQAPLWQPGPRRRHQPDDPRAGRRRLRQRARGGGRDRRRAVRPGRRLPHPGHRRQGRRRLPPRPGARRRRRPRVRSPRWSTRRTRTPAAPTTTRPP